LGQSDAIRSIREKVEIISNSNATILIQGETGTGKEVLAKYIHSHSPYQKGRFVKVDCSTLAPTLIESELFGHQKGAFTGAVEEKKGKFEQASGGTLFLDEVNNLGMDIQAKILGFLEDLTIFRVGGERPIRLDLRIVIASNIRLEVMVKKGLFREDLFFRINIINIELPPLRLRKDDIPELSKHFLGVFSSQHNKKILGFTSPAYKRLYGYHWPGNVRELRNVVYRAVIFCEAGEINETLLHLTKPGEPELASEVEEETRSLSSKIGPFERKAGLREVIREQLMEVSQRFNGNVNKIAGDLGISRQSVYYNFKKYKIDINAFRKRKS